MISIVASTAAILSLTLSTDGRSRTEQIVCYGRRAITNADVVQDLTCQQVDGFFVPSNLWRRSDGIEARYLDHPLELAKVRSLTAELDEMRRALATATAALAKADIALARDEIAIERGQKRMETLTDELAERDTTVAWHTLATCGACGLLTAASCIGVAHALPSGR